MIAFWLYDGVQHLLTAMHNVITNGRWENIRENDLKCSFDRNYPTDHMWNAGIHIMKQIKLQTTHGLLGPFMVESNGAGKCVRLQNALKHHSAQKTCSKELC